MNSRYHLKPNYRHPEMANTLMNCVVIVQSPGIENRWANAWRLKISFAFQSQIKKSLERLRRFQNLLRTCSNQVVFRQVHPTNCTGRINQEFSWPGNVLSVYTCARVKQIVLPDYLGFRIREKGERIAGLLAKVARYFWSIDADGNRTNARFFQLG